MDIYHREKEIIKEYSDVTIRIQSNNCSNYFDYQGHRVILGPKCNVLDVMFKFDLTNRFFIIKTDCISTMRNIFDSLYGKQTDQLNLKFVHDEQTKTDLPKWKFVLENIKCRDFLGLPIDMTDLYDIIVPGENFEYFVEVACRFELTRPLLQSIKTNMPEKYDQNLLSSELLELINQKNPTIVYQTDTSINCVDFETGITIQQSAVHNSSIFSLFDDEIIFGLDDHRVRIGNPLTIDKPTVYCASDSYKIDFVVGAKIDDEKFIISACKKQFQVWKCNPNTKICGNIYPEQIQTITFWHDLTNDKNYIVTGHFNHLSVWDFGGEYIQKINLNRICGRISHLFGKENAIVAIIYDRISKQMCIACFDDLSRIFYHRIHYFSFSDEQSLTAVSSDGKIIAVTSEAEIRLFNISISTSLKTRTFLNSGMKFEIGNDEMIIDITEIYRIESGKVIFANGQTNIFDNDENDSDVDDYDTCNNSIKSICITDDNEYLVYVIGRTIYVRNLLTGKFVDSYQLDLRPWGQINKLASIFL